MIKVWTDGAAAGLLDRRAPTSRKGGAAQDRGSTFLYLPGAPGARAVSVTMPVRLASWDMPYGIAPIFEMNLPEGVLRERLRLAFAKATGTFDDFDLLAIVGRSQVGRIRYTGPEDTLNENVPFQSVDELLAGRRGAGVPKLRGFRRLGRDGDLFRYLIERFASSSGISGVQPKVLVRDEQAFAAHHEGARLSQSYRGATHIVKLWEPAEFPHLGANEFFCLKVAERCGLDVPRFELAEDAGVLVIDRFDLRLDGTYRGFEDFCVLNARRTDQKYSGSYETSILRRFEQFANSPHVHADLENLFILIALNCAIRNGDAHLKNFGIVYDDVLGEARLAPVYDLVTTAVYLPKDTMALTLNGTTRWPTTKELQRLGETRAAMTPARTKQTLARIAEAIDSTAKELRAYMKEHKDFAEIGTRMLEKWEEGIAHSVVS